MTLTDFKALETELETYNRLSDKKEEYRRLLAYLRVKRSIKLRMNLEVIPTELNEEILATIDKVLVEGITNLERELLSL